jgi:hypothetical protein
VRKDVREFIRQGVGAEVGGGGILSTGTLTLNNRAVTGEETWKPAVTMPTTAAQAAGLCLSA